MIPWLEKQESYHRTTRKGSNPVVEEIFAEVMQQTIKKLQSLGWQKTFKYVTDEWTKARGDNRVGVRALHGAYLKVRQKMASLNMKIPSP